MSKVSKVLATPVISTSILLTQFLFSEINSPAIRSFTGIHNQDVGIFGQLGKPLSSTKRLIAHRVNTVHDDPPRVVLSFLVKTLVGTLYVCPHTVHSTVTSCASIIEDPLSLTQLPPHSQVILMTSMPIVGFIGLAFMDGIALLPPVCL